MRAAVLAMVWMATGMGTGDGRAAEAGEVRLLSIEDAVRLGLRQSHEVRLAASRAREAGTQVTAARSGVLPEVNGQFGYTRTLSAESIELPPGLDLGNLPFGRENTYNTGLGVVQPLYRPGAMRGIRIAREYYESAVDQATETELETVLGICLSYFDAVLAARLAEIAQAQIDQFDMELRDIRLRREAGEASELDVSRAEVNRGNVEPQLADALNARDASLLVLRQQINLDPATGLVLTDTLTLDDFEPVGDEELEALTGAPTRHRAAVRAAQRQLHVRRLEVRQARSAYWPSLDAVGNLGFQAYPDEVVPDARDWQENWTVGLQLTVPIFDGGRRRAGVVAAKEREEQATLQYEQLVLAIRTQVETWRMRLKRAEELIGPRARASRQAERVYELTGLSYRNGASSYLELTDARTNLRSARANEARTLHDYYAAYLNLIRTVGAPPSAFARAPGLGIHRAPAPEAVSPGGSVTTPP